MTPVPDPVPGISDVQDAQTDPSATVAARSARNAPVGAATARAHNRWLAKIRSAIGNQETAYPFVVTEVLDATAAAPRPDVARFPGLKYVQVVENGRGRVAVCYWESDSAFQAHGTNLAASLPSIREPLFAGHQSQAAFPGLPWYKRLRKWFTKPTALSLAVLAALAGLLSHVNGIVDFGAQWFTEAKASVYGSATALQASEGRTFTTTFDLQNESSFASMQARLERVEVQNENGERVDADVALDAFNRQNFPLIGPSEKKTVTLSGRPLKAGKYNIVVFGDYGPVHAFKRKPIDVSGFVALDVWEAATIDKTRSEVIADGKGYKVYFELRSGQAFPKGIVVRAELLQGPQVEIERIVVPRTDTVTGPIINQNGNAVGSLTLNGLVAFSVTKGYVALRSDEPIDESNWIEISKMLELKANPNW